MLVPRKVVGLIAEDALRRAGLGAILEENVGVSPWHLSIDEAVSSDGLDAVLLDSGGVRDVLQVVERFKRERPELKVVVLGDEVDPEHVQSLIAAGARGYFLPAADESEIRSAVTAVLNGQMWAPRKLLAELKTAELPTATEEFNGLMTPRELELLGFLKDGRTNRQIAAAMGIELVTVKAHLGRMLRKVGVKSRIELTLKAMADGPNAE